MTKEEIKKVLDLALEYYKLEIFGTGKESQPPTQERIDYIYERVQPSLLSDLDEAADKYEQEFADDATVGEAFIDGAVWMAGQDKKEIEHAFFLGYNECEDRMKKEFEKRAMTGTINNTGYPTTIQLNTLDSSLKNGEEVIVQVIKK